MFASKIVPESEKTILWKRASRLHEVLIFKDLDPQNPPKIDDKSIEKSFTFLIETSTEKS